MCVLFIKLCYLQLHFYNCFDLKLNMIYLMLSGFLFTKKFCVAQFAVL